MDAFDTAAQKKNAGASPPMDGALYGEGEVVFCFHGPMMYEAKVLKVEFWDETKPFYYIHYQGWNKHWDEWVAEDRVLKYCSENNQKKRELSTKHRQAKAANGDKKKKVPGRGRKRKHDEDDEEGAEFAEKPEIRLAIPNSLKKQLVDDWEEITRYKKLAILPRGNGMDGGPNVKDILDAYLETVPPDSDSCVKDVVDGVRGFFDEALGTSLLYRFERLQYANLRKDAQFARKPASEIYGIEHLLRVFVNLPMLLSGANMEEEAVVQIQATLKGILGYLSKNIKNLLASYESAPPQYIRMSTN